MNANAAARYQARLRKVLEYIETHLYEDLTVDQLSSLAAFSKYHFHRQFAEFTGIGVYQYVKLCRLKRAGHQLAFRDSSKIVDIALANGYEGPEAFARAFKNSIGQSPSDFRKQPQWGPWYAIYQPISALRSTHMATKYRADDVKIVHFSDTPIAVLEHRGDPKLIGNSIRTFIEWRKQNHLPPKDSATFNIISDDPDLVDPAQYRFDLCTPTPREVVANDFGVVGKTIPGGRCAVLRHVGSDDTLADAIRYLYTEWLPNSGEELRDFPLYLQRVKFFPDVPEHAAVIDVFLPLRWPREAIEGALNQGSEA